MLVPLCAKVDACLTVCLCSCRWMLGACVRVCEFFVCVGAGVRRFVGV